MAGLIAYPDPFKEPVTIEFSSDITGIVTVKLFDNLGQLVKIIYQAKIEQGVRHKMDVDGSNLTSGIYFCVFQAEKTVLTQKKV